MTGRRDLLSVCLCLRRREGTGKKKKKKRGPVDGA